MNNRYLLWILILLTVSISACRNQNYFQVKKLNDKKFDSLQVPYAIPVPPEHILSEGDALDVLFFTPDEINKSLMSTTNDEEKINANKLYTLNTKGFIELPLLGPLKLAGLTTVQAEDSIRAKLSSLYTIGYLHVSLASYNVNVIGEVKQPGIKVIHKDNFTILEAIAAAGDLTDFGKKDRVLLLRRFGDNYKMYRIDLTNLNILTTDIFYLRSNDIIYVPPARSKAFLAALPYVSFGLTVLNTLFFIDRFYIRTNP